MEKIQGIDNKEFNDQLKHIFKEHTTDQIIPIMSDFKQLMTFYNCAMMEIETKFKVLNEEFSLRHDRNPINSIQCRIKKGVSIYEKLNRKNLLPISPDIDIIEDVINDIAGIRVVCSFVDDVYYLEKALLLQDDITLVARKDYIESPKPNGYKSLHLIVSVPIFLSNQKKSVKVEVQLRTIAMDAWAELEHQLKYKKGLEESSNMSKELFQCSELMSEFDFKMNTMLREKS